ncbi:hypothetical protein NIES21_40560 [Anabaenopsis circularis NIES-21]|uniref:Toxin-antitoxin system protein n=2 Tax=Nostocales TaxID=1161 RepID=A0A1Z4GL53_9CYAN|nr:toxin-antitoxin system protein [Nostoc cycadae]BAY18212.1 hypothetical protein NIES21_40560 [Anabaenopsis circularis NIES-21]GBE93181.1 hypothetical protein NCWK1_2942 [Nostoc cycadae WK-1]
MPELTVNISEASHQSLLKLAETSGESIQKVLDRAIENYRRYVFLAEANQAFTALRQNQTLWQEELAERQTWDQTVADGIEE